MDKVSKFTPCACVYDPSLDICEVDQFGFIDMRQAFLTGTIEGSVAPDDTSYNGIDEPSAIMHSPKDDFEAIRQAQYAASWPKSKDKPKSAAPAASPTEGGDASSAVAE